MGLETVGRLAFVHVPKTAGTSVTEVLTTCFAGAVCPAMTTLDYAKFDTETLTGWRFFKGHAYRRDYARFPAGTVKFTVLRDPVARALSYWRYYRGLEEAASDNPFVREAIRLAKGQSCIEFVYSDSPFVIEHVRLGQVRQFLSDEVLAAVGHRQFLSREIRARAVAEFVAETDAFDFVLTVEGMALSFPLMLRALGLHGAGPLARRNASVPGDVVEMGDVRRALVDVNGAEFDCYEHVRRRETDWVAGQLAAALRGVGPDDDGVDSPGMIPLRGRDLVGEPCGGGCGGAEVAGASVL